MNENRFKSRRIDSKILAGYRFILENREDIVGIVDELISEIPEHLICGDPVLKLHYVSSAESGIQADIGIPVRSPFEKGRVTTWNLPDIEVMSLKHSGSFETLGKSYRQLFNFTESCGLISDEYGIEIYHAGDGSREIEICFVIHAWESLFRSSLENVLGEKTAERIFGQCSELSTYSGLEQRFSVIRNALQRLEDNSDDEQRYLCLSDCSHVFPFEQIAKMRSVYLTALESGSTYLKSVDSVLDFISADPGWGHRPTREGHVIYSSKKPRDAIAHEAAATDSKRREAACFCPIIRKKLKDGMPPSFCYCGAGWFRQQWEGTTGKPVRVEMLKTLLNGDDECSFAIHLSDDL